MHDHETTSNRCAHPGCRCRVESGKQFCSLHCAQAQATPVSGGCGCNHPECAGSAHR